MYKNSTIQAVRLLEPRKKVHTGWKIPYVHLLGPVRLFGSPEYVNKKMLRFKVYEAKR